MALWGDTDVDASIPKYLTAGDNAKCYFIDTTEAGVTANRAKGFHVPGWYKYKQESRGGVVRNDVELLCAFSADGSAVADTGDAGVDATDDGVLAD